MKKTKVTNLNTGKSYYRDIDTDDGELFISFAFEREDELKEGKDGKVYFPIIQEPK